MVRRGVTVIEVLVSIGILALLFAMLLPAVQGVREASRRLSCQSNLKQFGLAIHNYESDHGAFPPAGAGQYIGGPYVALLPYLGEASLWQLISLKDFDLDLKDELFQRELTSPRPLWLCPSSGLPTSNSGRVSYAGNTGTGLPLFGYNGIFGLLPSPGSETIDFRGTGAIRAADVTDGLSNTVAMAEWAAGPGSPRGSRNSWYWETPELYPNPQDFEPLATRCESIPPSPLSYGWRGFPKGGPWYMGPLGDSTYNHVLPPNSPSCGDNSGAYIYSVGSQHTGGANLLFADGHVRFMPETVDRVVWREFGSRCPSAIRVP